jgi:hypothetical protein
VSRFQSYRAIAPGVRETNYVGGANSPVLPNSTNGGYEYTESATLHSDGSVSVLATCNTPTATPNTYADAPCVARITPNGALDTSFASNGYLAASPANVPGLPRAQALTQQRDGKLLIATLCGAGANLLCVARYHRNGTLDTGYANGGVAISTSLQNFVYIGTALTVDARGGHLAASGCSGANGFEHCLVRLSAGSAAKYCTMDVDGDGVALSANDQLLVTRAALGFRGDGIVAGVAPAPLATRTTGAAVRDYLVNQCSMSLQP